MRSVLANKHTLRVLPITQAMSNWLAESYPSQFDPGGPSSHRWVSTWIVTRICLGSEEARSQLELPQGITVGYTGHLYQGRGLDLMQDLARLNPQVQFLVGRW